MIQPLFGGLTAFTQRTFLRDVIAGLSRPRKALPGKYLYDQCGSQIFEKICNLDEYYAMRVELGIVKQEVRDIAAFCGQRCTIIEFGSGAGVQSRVLLESLRSPAAYYPIDISPAALYPASEVIAQTYPEMEVFPICGDFTRRRQLPSLNGSHSKAVAYFSGSSIGNFGNRQALALLENAARICRGATGPRRPGLLLGVDLRKDREVLEAAYDDRWGVTAEFNLNILRRINRELGADFDLDAFRHRAIWNDAKSRIEMHLESLAAQTVRVGEREFTFQDRETIRTQLSYKYEPREIAALADKAGFAMNRRWLDHRNYFMVAYFTLR